MTLEATDIKNQFVKLDKSEQLELMQFFLTVIAEQNDWQFETGEDFTLDDHTKVEIDRRLRDLRSGKDKGLTASELDAYLDKEFSANGLV